jgi:glycosyltransferase involved in cell wall biosynthesis
VIHDAIDLERFTPQPLPGPEVPPTVTMVARLVPFKRHELFLRALAILAADRLPDVRAVLVGDGDERARLETLVAELGLTANVRFTGELDDVRPPVAEAHVAALTSSYEGFGDVLAEAMAMGRPVVATRGGAVAEVVRDGRDGFVTGDDPAEVASALERLLTDEALREQMAASALERAEGFGWPRKVREQEAVYREAAVMSV